MAEELVEAYRRGKIGRVTLVRKLMMAGLSASAALALAVTAAGPAEAAPPNVEGRNIAANVISNLAHNNPNLPANVANRMNNVAENIRNNANNNDNAAGGNNGGIVLE
jgi:hypothetical protein